jgi:hypothetical protein
MNQTHEDYVNYRCLKQRLEWEERPTRNLESESG